MGVEENIRRPNKKVKTAIMPTENPVSKIKDTVTLKPVTIEIDAINI